MTKKPQNKIVKRIKIAFILLFLIITPLFFVVLIAGPNAFLFHPIPGIQITPKDVGIDYEDRMIEIENGQKINAWYFKGDGKSTCDVLYLHGNSGNLTISQRHIMPLINAGYSVLAIDYRGFGRSDGHVDIDGILTDSIKAKETLKKTIIVFGQSLGGFTALRLAEKSPANIKGTMIDGGFADLRPLVKEKAGNIWIAKPFKDVIAWMFPDRKANMKKIHMPLLFIAGEKDKIVPKGHTKKAFDDANEPKAYIELKGAGHVKSAAYEESRKAIFKFIEENCK